MRAPPSHPKKAADASNSIPTLVPQFPPQRHCLCGAPPSPLPSSSALRKILRKTMLQKSSSMQPALFTKRPFSFCKTTRIDGVARASCRSILRQSAEGLLPRSSSSSACGPPNSSAAAAASVRGAAAARPSCCSCAIGVCSSVLLLQLLTTSLCAAGGAAGPTFPTTSCCFL